MQRTLINIGPRQVFGFCFFISAFELVTYMASDLIMPAMLSVTTELQADVRHVPNAFNLYLLGGVCLQWLIGPLSDQWGRRRVLLIGCAVFAVACTGAFATQSIEAFNLLRWVQGMGLGFVIAVSYPALQEVFCEADAVRLMALLGNIALLSPLIGPLLGIALLQWLSWRELFLGLGLLASLVWLGLLLCMPETIGVVRRDGHRQNALRFSWRQTGQRYRHLFGNGRFLAASFALGLMSLPLIAWIGLSPLLLIQLLGLTPLEYALWQIPIFAAVIVGNLLLDRLLPTHALPQLIRLALWPFCLGLVALIVCALSGASLGAVVASLALSAVGLGMSNAALYRLALFASDDSKGLVSALIGMISIAVMSLGGSLIAFIGGGTRLELFSLFAAVSGLMCLPLLTGLLQGNHPDGVSTQ